MQGRPVDEVELWDAQAIAGHLVDGASVFGVLAVHRRELFPDSMFFDLFPSRTGRPSIPSDVIASIIVLQRLEGLTDRETMAAVRTDLRWKVACGLPIAHPGFDASVLTYWRKRLAGSERPNRIFDAVRDVIVQTGVLKGKNKRALDSTVFDDAVATQDTVTQLVSAIRIVAREVPGAAAVVAERCSAHDYSVPGKPRIAWNDVEERQALVSGLVNDALRILAAFEDSGAMGLSDAQQQALALLALIAGQDVEPAEGSDGTDGRWRIARKVAHDRIISTVDQQARHARKTRENRQDGFKGHVAVEPSTGLVTDCEMTMAVGAQNADAATGIRLLRKDKTLRTTTGRRRKNVKVLGDSAYGTGAMLAELDQAGHTPIIKPWPVNPAIPGGFTIDDFTVDEAAQTVTCPAGQTVPMGLTRQARFGSRCTSCPLRARCTTSKTGRDVNVHQHHTLMRAHRERMTAAALQETYRQDRPMVERTLAWLVAGGNRRLRYRGTTKNDAWFHDRAAAINLKRLAVMGLTRQDGAWATA